MTSGSFSTLALNMRANDARDRTLVGDGQSRVTELRGAQQLFALRRTLQERKIGEPKSSA
ncbi:hypothetical protein A9R05_38920 (plasmid) [Burkholderia sp. KK1]|nr:hypothetical protein A9R05_38920 [Burkholderia sp. KK1]